MSDVNDNPKDHSHSHYNGPWVGFMLLGMLLVVISIVCIGTDCTVREDHKRLDILECRLASDETQCLRELAK